MVKVLSQSVSVDNFPSCTKGSSEMLSDIQKLEVKKKKKNQYTLHIHFILGGNTLRRAKICTGLGQTLRGFIPTIAAEKFGLIRGEKTSHFGIILT